MADSILEQEIRRLKNLKSCKDKKDQDFVKIAKINLWVRAFKANPIFDTDSSEGQKEQELAESKYKSYLENNQLESDSELNTLSSLVFNEVFEARLQKQLNKIAKENKYPPDALTKQLTEIQNQNTKLKLKLGIDKEDNKQNELTEFQKLQKRFDRYIDEHENEFTTTCGCCGEPLHFKKRVKDFDNIKHPWFAGRWFFNYEILKDVKTGKLEKEDAWRYMTCASSGGQYKDTGFSKEYCVDYIDYCLEHWGEIISHFKE